MKAPKGQWIKGRYVVWRPSAKAKKLSYEYQRPIDRGVEIEDKDKVKKLEG